MCPSCALNAVLIAVALLTAVVVVVGYRGFMRDLG
jgi:hypothetical protein